jgi:putative heme-binding domain-containing protein
MAPEGWTPVETKLAESPDPEVRALVQSLGLTFGSPRAQAALRALAASPSAGIAERRAAVESLLRARSPNLAGLLQDLCTEPDLRAAAIRGLAQFDDARTPEVLLGGFPKWSVEVQRDALNTLSSRATYARPLLTAVAAGRVPKASLTAELVRQLRNLKDEEIKRQLTELWGVMQDPSPDMNAEIERVKRQYWAGGSQPGDASRGRVVFNQVCAQCHHLFDTGGQVGPDITGANRGDLDYLLQNILFPNAVIPNEYRQTILETKDGRVLTGIIKSAEGPAYQLQTANELATLPKAEVAKVEQLATSMMPEGLLAALEPQAMRDLLYYLGRPGQVPLPSGK